MTPSMGFHDRADRHAMTVLDEVVRVDEVHLQAGGQPSSHFTLSGAPVSNQDNIHQSTNELSNYPKSPSVRVQVDTPKLANLLTFFIPQLRNA